MEIRRPRNFHLGMGVNAVAYEESVVYIRLMVEGSSEENVDETGDAVQEILGVIGKIFQKHNYEL